jgi:hypothetical protein
MPSDPAYHRAHYEENKEDYLQKNKQYKRVFEALLVLLKNRPCLDCGGKFPSCAMDFDHIDGDKVMNIASIVRRCTPAALVSELKKCELVCANCHRIRTISRLEKDEPTLTLSELWDIFSARKKWYDREVWQELFQMVGAELPPLPEKPKRAPRNIRKVGPEGTSWCSTHKSFISLSSFERNASRWNGLQGQCIDCRKKAPSRRPKKKQKVLVRVMD